MTGRYVTFLIREGSGQVIDGTVSHKPSPRCPEVSEWKIVCDARGNVTVRSFHLPRPRLIGTATWNGALTGCRQHQRHVPSDAKWMSIESALRRELATAPGGADVETASWWEARDLYARDADWNAMGSRYDHQGVDRYFMRKARRVVLVGLAIAVATIVIVTLVRMRSKPERVLPPSPPMLERPD